MKTALGYIRVSRDREGDKLSPGLQRQRITDYCSAKGWRLVKVHEDINVPGGSFDRPGWSSLMAEVEPGDIIVCNEFTRIGRHLRETLASIEDLRDRGVEIVSLEGEFDTTTAAGKLQYQILLVLAEFERNRMSERLRQAHDQIAHEGLWKGGGIPPLGYSYTPGTGRLEVESEEADTVRLIYDLRDKGWSIRAIVRHLADQGTPGKKGRMNYTSVRSTLRNPAYVSKRFYQGALLPMNHEPIIPAEQWERVQARNRSSDQKARKYLLSGFLVCGDCGARMVHQSQGPGRRQYYACKRYAEFGTGRRLTVEEHVADQWVIEKFFAHIDPVKLEAAEKKIQGRQPKKFVKVEKLEARLQRSEAALDRLVTDYYDSDTPPIPPEQFRNQITELVRRRDTLVGELQKFKDARLLETPPPIGLVETWPLMTLDERRESLRLFIEKITVMPVRSGKRIDPARLKIKWRF
jgi:site-specific DNA recombinase